MQGPELKPGLNLPYLGVTHWHSPSEYVFLSSPGLKHTLPSNHKPHTSPTPSPALPPPTVSPTGSFTKHPPSPTNRFCLLLCVSHFLIYTHTFTGVCQSVGLQACFGGVDVMEVRQRNAIHYLSPTPLKRIQTIFLPLLCLTKVLVGCHRLISSDWTVY